MASVFISHASKDKNEAARLRLWLSEQGFEGIFLDFDEEVGIRPGADWERTIYRAIDLSAAVLLVLTPNWLASKWCFAEFTQARALGKAIYPLIEAPGGGLLVSPDIQHLDLVSDRNGGLTRLSRDLTEILVNSQRGFRWDSSRSPFPGLASMGEADAAVYFGRDDDVRRLIERLNARRAQGGDRLVLLLGASGSGKSSLIRAGVLPRLARDKANWIIVPPFRPQFRAVDELAQALGMASDGDWRAWRERLSGPNAARDLMDLARDIRTGRNASEARVLITIDQVEELFSISKPDDAEAFFELLRILTAEDMPFLVLAGLRSDYLGRWQAVDALAERRFEQVSLKPMPVERVRQIIEGPARVAGLKVDDALIAAATKDAAVDDALPLLAFALRELSDRYGAERSLTLPDYQLLGDATGALSPLENALRRRADATLNDAKVGADDLVALKSALVPAVARVNAEGDYVRQPARLDDMPARAKPLIERLAAARLLSISGDGTEIWVEVVHEALLRKWPTLRTWLDEEREFIVGREQLKRDVDDWQKAPDGAKMSALLTGLKLSRAENWLATQVRHLSETERRFIADSMTEARVAATQREAERAERERLRSQLLRGAMAAAVVAIAIALVAGWQWWRADLFAKGEAEQRALAERQADLAQSREAEATAQSKRAEAQRAEAVHQQTLAHSNQVGALAALSSATLALSPARAAKLALASWPRTALDTSPKLAVSLSALQDAVLNLHERRVFAGHTAPVRTTAFTPDGTRLLTASDDHTVRIVSVATGGLLFVLQGHSAAVTKVQVTPAGDRVLTASDDGTARVWDLATGKQLVLIEEEPLTLPTIAFSTDGTRIMIRSASGALKTWNARTGELINTIKLGAVIYAFNSAVLSPDNQQILTTSFSKSAVLWDAATGTKVRSLDGHEDVLVGAAYSPDGKRILTTSVDGSAKVWNAASGAIELTLAGHTDVLRSGAFSPDGTKIVTTAKDNATRIWDAATGALVTTIETTNETVDTASFSPDSQTVVTKVSTGKLFLWSVKSGRSLAYFAGHTGSVTDIAFSPDGQFLATASIDKTARLWQLQEVDLTETIPSNGISTNLAAFSPDGRKVAVMFGPFSAQIRDLAGSVPPLNLNGHEGFVVSAAFSADGTRLVTTSQDKTARIWDVATGKQLAVLSGHSLTVNKAVFSPDGKQVLTTSMDDTVSIWDAASGQQLRTVQFKEPVNSAVFSPDGSRILMASSDATASIWDVALGTELAVLKGHSKVVRDAAYAPDGRSIVTASEDKTAKIWDATSNTLEFTLKGHTGDVRSAVFSADGKRLLTASADGTGRIWDRSTGEAIAVLSYDSGVVLDAADMAARLITPKSGFAYMGSFSPDGSKAIMALSDDTVRVWDISKLPGGSLFEVACAMLPDHDLTDIANEYGLANLDPICEGTQPLPSPTVH